MNFDLYAYVSILDFSFEHFFIVSSKKIFTPAFLFDLFHTSSFLYYSSSDESDDSDKGESEKVASESGSAGTFGTILVRLLHGLVFPLVVTIFSDEPCDGDRGSISLQTKNIREGVCTKCASTNNIYFY